MKTLKNIFAVTLIITHSFFYVDTPLHAMKRSADNGPTEPSQPNKRKKTSDLDATEQPVQASVQATSVSTTTITSDAPTLVPTSTITNSSSSSGSDVSLLDCLGNAKLVRLIVQYYQRINKPLAEIKSLLVQALATQRTHPLTDAGKLSLANAIIPLITTNSEEKMLEHLQWKILLGNNNAERYNLSTAILKHPNAQYINPAAWLTAQLQLGIIHRLGNGVEQSNYKAYAHFVAIITYYNAQTINMHAFQEANRQLELIYQDLQNIIKTTTNNQTRLIAHLLLGEMHYYGYGTDQDYQQTITHLMYVIDPNNKAQDFAHNALIKAHYFLGEIYLDDEECQRAFEHFTRALILINQTGTLFVQPFINFDAVKNAEIIQLRNELNIKYRLGEMYYYGDGTEQDDQEALKCFYAVVNAFKAQTINANAFQQSQNYIRKIQHPEDEFSSSE
jgi:TPR repeat protein